MLGNLTGWHLLIILAVIVLLFGASRLPALARSLGQSKREFQDEMRKGREEDAARAAREGRPASDQTATRTSTSSVDDRVVLNGEPVDRSSDDGHAPRN